MVAVSMAVLPGVAFAAAVGEAVAGADRPSARWKLAWGVIPVGTTAQAGVGSGLVGAGALCP
jgi:hypothetical protein